MPGAKQMAVMVWAGIERLPGIAGSTLLPDEHVGLVLDIPTFVKQVAKHSGGM